ncbi:MAG: RluA family pseudouridine synthase [Verrucomicrobia bacterium]|nr:RluA family pseudouridine synthase [Verrucomicrobiota bacterium]
MKQLVDQETPLLTVLAGLSPDSSKNTLRTWVESGRVTVDGKRVERANLLVQPGQEVIVGPKVSFVGEEIRILYEDDHLVVLEKPEGLLSVATDFETRATVHHKLKRRYHNRSIFPVHRLDRETSGVMLFAYTPRARDNLKGQFEARSIDKVYYAFVQGILPERQGTWESYLLEDETYFVKSQEMGKLAITHYEVLKEKKFLSFLKLKPETGRKNQLRVHTSEAGVPIVGDKKYGATANPIKRLCLHAQSITFTHPENGKRLTFSVPLPPLFSKILDVSI